MFASTRSVGVAANLSGNVGGFLCNSRRAVQFPSRTTCLYVEHRLQTHAHVGVGTPRGLQVVRWQRLAVIPSDSGQPRDGELLAAAQPLVTRRAAPYSSSQSPRSSISPVLLSPRRKVS